MDIHIFCSAISVHCTLAVVDKTTNKFLQWLSKSILAFLTSGCWKKQYIPLPLEGVCSGTVNLSCSVFLLIHDFFHIPLSRMAICLALFNKFEICKRKSDCNKLNYFILKAFKIINCLEVCGDKNVSSFTIDLFISEPYYIAKLWSYIISFFFMK